MAKRKRDEGDDDEHDERRLTAKQKRVEHKLKQGVTKVGHAFKIAKGFERQKLGRRRKTAAAQDGQKDVERIDLEIAGLKVRSACSPRPDSRGLTCHRHSIPQPLLNSSCTRGY